MPQRDLNFGRTLIVVAHPDDEAIGCGVLLQRLQEPTVAFLTDGAPTDRYFWGQFGSRTAYADLRARETLHALGSLDGVRIEKFGARDQQLLFHLDAAADWLRKLVASVQPDTIVTHAYEGGHPDHDCASFLCALVGVESGAPVWEMPLYRRANGNLVRQRPLGKRTHQGVTLAASTREQRQKSRMIEAYSSQDEFLKTFETGSEQFYPQRRHDYSRPPHEGKLNYECWGWEITGDDLCAAFSKVFSKDQMQKAKTA